MTVHTGRHFLQIPGPTNVPDRVLRAMDMPTMDHRGPEFAEIGFAVLAAMQRVFRIGHLGECNELTLLGALTGVEMGLSVAGVPYRAGGVDAAMKFFEERSQSNAAPHLKAVS